MGDSFDEGDSNRIRQIHVTDARVDIFETQAFLEDDPRNWGVQDTTCAGSNYIEVYIDSEVDEFDTHEGPLVNPRLLVFMAGRGWHATNVQIGRSPATDEWVPCIGFSRGPELFDKLVSFDIPVEPPGYDWPETNPVQDSRGE